jgi:type III secretory pathway component EscV
MLSITGVLIIGLLLAFFGQWLVGGLLLVAMYLFLMVTITHYVQKWMDRPPVPEI